MMRLHWLLLIGMTPVLPVIYLVVNYYLVDHVYPVPQSPRVGAHASVKWGIPPRAEWINIRNADLHSDQPDVEQSLRAVCALADEIAEPSWDVQPFHLKHEPSHFIGTPGGAALTAT
jgi:hypothetical protein